MTTSPQDIGITLEKACQKIATGLSIRYGSGLFTRTHGDFQEFPRILARVFSCADINAQDALVLATWLQKGVRALGDYPPNIETLMHLGQMIKAFPPTEHQETLRNAWYGLDTSFSQTYMKSWRSDKALDEVSRERVWLNALERIGADAGEIAQAQKAIHDSGLFRQFPPSLEQFQDAIHAIRCQAPLVEEAWLEALNRGHNALHPLIVQARSLMSAFDMNMNSKDRDTENRFKVAYRKLLLGEVGAITLVVEEKTQDQRDYESSDSLAERIKNW